jgi:sugar-specific transcriptional regulator TrmB
MLEKYLQDIGLSEKEAIVYISLLSVENSSVLDLSKKTKLNRSTTYVILESLAKKGLVTETTVGKKTHYQAEPPERLETYVEQRKIMLDEQSKKLKDVIPQIKSVQREGGEKPIVKLFEGKDGILSLNADLYENDDQGGIAHLIYSSDLLDSVFSKEERAKYKKVRLEKGVKTRVFYTSTKNDIPSDDTGERIKIDPEKYPITCDISIYKDRVRIGILGKKLSGIFIKSQDLANTLRSLFSLAHDSINKK